ncbi:MAG: beta-ketoacyl-ACP synthase II [Acidimicrobiaceae bacterium]|nr:beta-ketoacyl-ACP synthase II [Acidimicrobiaceae bacterium]MXW75199.1 beta-ketoacyl-ACP synthase II [Acidimicrobiaceae bacterium]MYA74086.1 beta-ketoacyl-ACP synthase II [Acidimicrobiaceae bacterium]MYC42381.1 beta-ketoacyl-ACP synthase II [Acidimicrobiaceae bacterium]MYD06280.1 beta-ketoacyl-ACP synthase II [Acidimicrobiaceae bacterium]
MQGRRVAVTGLGIVAPCGVGVEAFWAGLCSPAPVGPRVLEDWDASPYFENAKEVRRSDRFTQLAVAAAEEALAQAGELGADPARLGTFIGTGVGGIETLETQIETRLTKGERRVSPFLVPMMMTNAAAATLSMRHGWQGPCENTVTACAAGTHAIGNAARLISNGLCDAVLAGGSEAPFTPTAVAGFSNMTALSSSGVSRPFDPRRDGFVMAEGAAVLVLEELSHAEARGATILGEILGSASTADAHHITAPAPGGTGAITCMRLAIEDAGITAEEVVHINAHGTSTDKNDAAEAAAIAKIFGTPGPVITSTKGVTGHALGGAGALEAAAVLLSMSHRLIPPTAGHETLDPEMPDIDLVVGEPRRWVPGPSLSNSFGFGGHNGTLVIGPG